MAAGLVTISKHFTFEASHILPKHHGKCSRLHGHSWGLDVGIRGPVNLESGFVWDYGELKAVVQAHIIDRVDHRHLGQGGVRTLASPHDQGAYSEAPFEPSFYPSSENLIHKFVQILQPLILTLAPKGVHLAHVIIEETCTSRCEWRADA